MLACLLLPSFLPSFLAALLPCFLPCSASFLAPSLLASFPPFCLPSLLASLLPSFLASLVASFLSSLRPSFLSALLRPFLPCSLDSSFPCSLFCCLMSCCVACLLCPRICVCVCGLSGFCASSTRSSCVCRRLFLFLCVCVCVCVCVCGSASFALTGGAVRVRRLQQRHSKTSCCNARRRRTAIRRKPSRHSSWRPPNSCWRRTLRCALFVPFVRHICSYHHSPLLLRCVSSLPVGAACSAHRRLNSIAIIRLVDTLIQTRAY